MKQNMWLWINCFSCFVVALLCVVQNFRPCRSICRYSWFLVLDSIIFVFRGSVPFYVFAIVRISEVLKTNIYPTHVDLNCLRWYAIFDDSIFLEVALCSFLKVIFESTEVMKSTNKSCLLNFTVFSSAVIVEFLFIMWAFFVVISVVFSYGQLYCQQ